MTTIRCGSIPTTRAAHGYRDIICPPLYLQYAILGVSRRSVILRPDGSSGAVSGSLAFPRAPRRMAGGESTTFHLPAYHRDEIEMIRTIESIVEKEGRSGTIRAGDLARRVPQSAARAARRGDDVDDRQARA